MSVKPRKKYCKRGHPLFVESNLRWAIARKVVKDKVYVYPRREFRRCQSVRDAQKRLKIIQASIVRLLQRRYNVDIHR